MNLSKEIKTIVSLALDEDLGKADITSDSLISKKQSSRATLMAKEQGVICGLEVFKAVFKTVAAKLGGNVKIKIMKKDGQSVKAGEKVALVEGSTRIILAGERAALNFVQQLSGVSTLTNTYVKKAKGSRVLDTRKTVPGLRLLQKYAVKMGGGTNHRIGLYDAVLIKDNHIKAAGGIARAVALAKSKNPKTFIEVEARTISEVVTAVLARPNRILLDNFKINELKTAVKLCRRAKIESEASGGINLKNISSVAKTGVDFISVGALTHSAPALDFNLKIS